MEDVLLCPFIYFLALKRISLLETKLRDWNFYFLVHHIKLIQLTITEGERVISQQVIDWIMTHWVTWVTFTHSLKYIQLHDTGTTTLIDKFTTFSTDVDVWVFGFVNYITDTDTENKDLYVLFSHNRKNFMLNATTFNYNLLGQLIMTI